MFKKFNEQLNTHMQQFNNSVYFAADVTQEEIWDTYLNAFPENERQFHNCNCCRHFLRDVGGLIVFVKEDNKIVKKTMWEFSTLPEYQPAVNALHNLVKDKTVRIADIPLKNVGIEYNYSEKHSRNFYHFAYKFDKTQTSSVKSKLEGSLQVFSRTLSEWDFEAVDYVIQLIDERQLPSTDSAGLKELSGYYNEMIAMNATPVEYAAANLAQAYKVTNLRNTALGTLITDLSKVGLSDQDEIDKVIGAYKRMVDPANYKQGESFISPATMKKLIETFVNTGLQNRLNRRYLQKHELNNVKWKYVEPATNNFLLQMQKDLPVDVKRYSNAKTIKYSELLELPFTELRMLFQEPKNLCTVLTSVEDEGPQLLSNKNDWNIMYTGNMSGASMLHERVKAAGGTINYFNVSLGWHTNHDLDLALVLPNNDNVYYRVKKRMYKNTFFTLDIDAHAGGNDLVPHPVENIYSDALPDGKYKILVTNYLYNSGGIEDGFDVVIKLGDQLWEFHEPHCIKTNQKWIKEFEVINGKINLPNGTVKQITKWGVKTNVFHNVEHVVEIDEHVLFLNSEFHPDETLETVNTAQILPAIYNDNKKAIQAMLRKTQVTVSPQSTSGLGFIRGSGDKIIIEATINNSKEIYSVTF